MTYTVKPSEIYRTADAQAAIAALLIAKNLIIVDFRPPVSGETFINKFDNSSQCATMMCHHREPWSTYPRFIVTNAPNRAATWWE